jgi:hypothetical protein
LNQQRIIAMNSKPTGVEGVATSCPRCRKPSQPKDAPQVCEHCGKTFVLRAGHLLDESVTPPEPGGKEIKSKSSGVVMRKLAVVGPHGVAHGTLDPVTGYIPMDKQGITYEDIATIAVWRRLDWFTLIATVLFLVPLSSILVMGAFEEVGFLIFGLPVWALTAFALWRAIAVGARFMRVVGSRLVLELRYDAPVWRRKRFFREAMRRAGIENAFEP